MSDISSEQRKKNLEKLAQLRNQFIDAGMNIYLAGMHDMLEQAGATFRDFKQTVTEERSVKAEKTLSADVPRLPTGRKSSTAGKLAVHPDLPASGPLPDAIGDCYTRPGAQKALRLSLAAFDRRIRNAGIKPEHFRRPYGSTKIAFYKIADIDRLQPNTRGQGPFVVPVPVITPATQVSDARHAKYVAAGRKVWTNMSKAAQKRKIKAMLAGRKRKQDAARKAS